MFIRRSIDQRLLSVGEMVPPNAIRRLHGPPPSAFAHSATSVAGSLLAMTISNPNIQP